MKGISHQMKHAFLFLDEFDNTILLNDQLPSTVSSTEKLHVNMNRCF